MMDKNESGSWYVYIVKTRDNALYTGISTDVDRRFKEHLDCFTGRSNKGAKYFRAHEPVKVVFREAHPSRSAASSREFYIKKMSVRDKRALIESSSNACR